MAAVELTAAVRSVVAAEVDGPIRSLWDHSTADPDVPGFRQLLDRVDEPGATSTAATGFALAAWCVGLWTARGTDTLGLRPRG